jgi:hypothetical protein
MGGPGLFRRLADIRILVAVREVRRVEQGHPGAPREPATMDAREFPWSREASSIAVDFDDSADHLDAVAGSEFVDDRIRLRE